MRGVHKTADRNVCSCDSYIATYRLYLYLAPGQRWTLVGPGCNVGLPYMCNLQQAANMIIRLQNMQVCKRKIHQICAGVSGIFINDTVLYHSIGKLAS